MVLKLVVFSRLELLNQRQLLSQAQLGHSLLERQLAFLLNTIRKMSIDISSSWKSLMEKDRQAIESLADAVTKEPNYMEELAKIQPEISMANVVKEHTAGLTIPKIEIIQIQKETTANIPVTVSFAIDKSIDVFELYYNEILNYVDRMINFQRLVTKIRKTRRQLTMLENDLIPELKENIKLIRFTLNQRELEDKIRLMKISKKFKEKS